MDAGEAEASPRWDRQQRLSTWMLFALGLDKVGSTGYKREHRREKATVVPHRWGDGMPEGN